MVMVNVTKVKIFKIIIDFHKRKEIVSIEILTIIYEIVRNYEKVKLVDDD